MNIKKVFLSLFAVVLLPGFVSCSDDDEASVLGALVEVTVKNSLGIPQPNTDVYMFKNVESGETTDLSTASKKETTDENGLARFKLNLTELNIIESKTPLYFAVYYKVGDTFLLKDGEQSLTVKRDDKKQITIPI